MLTFEYPNELLQHIGRELGPSDWIVVDQAMIDRFADATGDHQWIHVDVERARREMPGGKTIAHGYLTLSLVPGWRRRCSRLRGRAGASTTAPTKFASSVPCRRVRASACASGSSMLRKCRAT